jgi:hypothetical protein
MGMARGEKATFLSRRVESPPPVGMTPFEDVSKKRLKPTGRSTVPPTMRNMLSGTSKIFSIAVPNTKKKKKQIREEYLQKLAPSNLGFLTAKPNIVNQTNWDVTIRLSKFSGSFLTLFR